MGAGFPSLEVKTAPTDDVQVTARFDSLPSLHQTLYLLTIKTCASVMRKGVKDVLGKLMLG